MCTRAKRRVIICTPFHALTLTPPCALHTRHWHRAVRNTAKEKKRKRAKKGKEDGILVFRSEEKNKYGRRVARIRLRMYIVPRDMPVASTDKKVRFISSLGTWSTNNGVRHFFFTILPEHGRGIRLSRVISRKKIDVHHESARFHEN